MSFQSVMERMPAAGMIATNPLAVQANAGERPQCRKRFKVQAVTRLMASSWAQATAAGDNHIRVISQLVIVWKTGATSV